MGPKQPSAPELPPGQPQAEPPAETITQGIPLPALDERPPANVLEAIAHMARQHGPASFREVESNLEDFPEVGGGLQAEFDRLCGHAVFKNTEWTDSGRGVLRLLRHRSEASHPSYAAHLARGHHTLSLDDLHAFIDENSRSRAHLGRMHSRCSQRYGGAQHAPQLLAAIKCMIALMDKNGGIASLLAAFRQERCNTGACEDRERRYGCRGGGGERFCPPSLDRGRHYAPRDCSPAPDACGADERCRPCDRGARYPDGYCSPEPDACGRSERCRPVDRGARYPYGGCTPAHDACGSHERCQPFDTDDRADCYHADAVSANRHTQRLRHAHKTRADCPCHCQGPDARGR